MKQQKLTDLPATYTSPLPLSEIQRIADRIVSYENLVLTLSYGTNPIAYTGGTSAATLTYTQTAVYLSGIRQNLSGTVTAGAAYTASAVSGLSVNAASGLLTAASNAGASTVDYGNPVISSFSYSPNPIVAAGGTSSPSVSYSQARESVRGSTSSRSTSVSATATVNGQTATSNTVTVSQDGDAGERTEMSPLTSGATLTYAMDAATGFTLQSSSTGVVSAAANSGAARSTTARVTVSLNGRSTTSSPATITQSGAEKSYRFYFDPDAGNLTVGYTSPAVIKRQRYENGTATGAAEIMPNNLFDFTSSDASKASVSASGTVTGVAEGNGIIITATLKNNSATASWYEQCQNPGANPKQATATINVVGANSGNITFPWDEGGEENL